MSDTSQGDHEYFRKRGFGGEMGFGDRPALLVIDIMNAFTNPGMPLGAALQWASEACTSLRSYTVASGQRPFNFIRGWKRMTIEALS